MIHFYFQLHDFQQYLHLLLTIKHVGKYVFQYEE